MSSFSSQTGNMAYYVSIIPATTTGSFDFGFERGASSIDSLSGVKLNEVITGETSLSYSLSATYQYVAVGNPESGRVGIYKQSEQPETWVKREIVTGATYSGTSVRFGERVAIDDERLLVGAPNAMIEDVSGRGAILVFDDWNSGQIGGATGSTWGQTAIVTGRSISGSAFGSSVDLTSAFFLPVGAPLQDNNSGAVYLFDADTLNPITELVVPDEITTNQFGGNVKILEAAGVGAVGVGAYNECSGSIYIYQQTAGVGWGKIQTIRAPVPASGDLFGATMDTDGSTLVVGSPHYNISDKSGATYIYDYSSSLNQWELTQQLAPDNLQANDKFGKNVSIEGNYILAASNSQSGSVYIFEKRGAWNQINQVSGSGVLTSGSFGGDGTGARNLTMSEGNFLVGTSNDDKFYYFITGEVTGGASSRISFTGISGKFFDNDGNFVSSYLSGEQLSVSGNIFSGYHNYFINTVLTNSNCSRVTGDIDSFYISGTGGLLSVDVGVNA